ncbi:hypothetical protein ABPG74_005465 [Tetrahymena malaccensis]
MFNQNNSNLNQNSQPMQDKNEATQASISQSALFQNNFGAPVSFKLQSGNTESSENLFQNSNNIFANNQQKNSIENSIFGQTQGIKNNQNAQQNANIVENKNNSSLFNNTGQNFFINSTQKIDNSKNALFQSASIFNSTNTDANNSLSQKKELSLFQQSQSPVQTNLFASNSTNLFLQANQQQNINQIGNQQSLFQAEQDKISLINTSNTKVQEIKPQKLEYLDYQVAQTVELRKNNPQNKSLNSPKFGQSAQNQHDSNQGYQKSDVLDTDSVHNINFSENKTEEDDDDDQGLADFPNKSFTAQQQGNNYDGIQSRFNSNKQEDDDDQNLEDFGPRDTRVAEQDFSIQKVQRVYQKIDMQKKISDLEIEIDYYKKQINTQQKTIQELQNQTNKIIQDNSKALSYEKDIFNQQIKKAESVTNKVIDQLKLFEKRYGFEIMKIALVRKMELTKNQNEIQSLKEELEKTKLILNNYKFKNDQLEIIKQQYLESQNKVKQELKIQEKYVSILEKLNSLVIKYNNQDVKQEVLNYKQNENIAQIDLNSQLLQQQEQDTLHQLEQILQKYQNYQEIQSEKQKLLPNIQTQFEIEKQKQFFQIQKLQKQVEQYVLQSLKLEEENREIKSKYQEQENLNYKNTRLNEELKTYYNCLLENQKNEAKNLIKQKNVLLRFLIAIIIIFAGFLIHSLLF